MTSARIRGRPQICAVGLVELNYKHTAERTLSVSDAAHVFLMQWKLQVQMLDSLLKPKKRRGGREKKKKVKVLF